MSAGPAPWTVRAERRAPFRRLVGVELAKVVGTRSDKILLALGLPLAGGLSVLAYVDTDTAVSGFSQLQPLLLTLPVGQLLVMAAVIKLVSGEWHHRSVQPTLLAQPSRWRYLAAQAVVVTLLGAVVTAVQLAAGLAAQQAVVHRLDAQDVVAARPGWALGVVLLAAGCSTAIAWVVGLLFPSTPTALTVYLVSVVALLFVRGAYSPVAQWFDPVQLAGWWAADPRLEMALPSVVAVALLVLGLWAGVRAVRYRDAG